MEKSSGTEEEWLNDSWSFKANLDNFFASIYQIHEKQTDCSSEVDLTSKINTQKILNEDLKTKLIDKTKIVGCMR